MKVTHPNTPRVGAIGVKPSLAGVIAISEPPTASLSLFSAAFAVAQASFETWSFMEKVKRPFTLTPVSHPLLLGALVLSTASRNATTL